MTSAWPSYLEAHASGRLRRKVEQARELLGRRPAHGERVVCRVCPRRCLVARLDDEPGFWDIVSSPDFGDAYLHLEQARPSRLDRRATDHVLAGLGAGRYAGG
jgi:uncharacterized Fe-S radical SAM superfamily protein PflX